MARRILAGLVFSAVAAIAPLAMSAPSHAGVNIDIFINPGPDRLTCRQAADRLYYRGYSRIQAFDCRGAVYGFEARRYHRWWIVEVSARSGRILSIR